MAEAPRRLGVTSDIKYPWEIMSRGLAVTLRTWVIGDPMVLAALASQRNIAVYSLAFVLLHTGYAINIIDEEEAQETLKIFKQLEMI